MADRRHRDEHDDNDRNRKSEWLGSQDSAAYDPVTPVEQDGLSILGGSSIRDGAINGVSDPVRADSAGPRERPREGDDIAAGPRRNPPLVEHAGTGDGEVSESGGLTEEQIEGRE